MRQFFVQFIGACVLAAPLTGCLKVMSATEALPPDPSADAMALAALRDDLAGDGSMIPPANALMGPKSVEMTPVTGLGMAQISRQPGSSINEKRLLAIRAARLEALRDLTEQVHGISLTSETTLRDTVVRNDSLRGLVEGEIRGARTERITPRGSDSYEVVLTLDPDVVAYIARAARLGV